MKINMFKKDKETMVSTVIRAIRNASVNNRTVELNYDNATSLVYPDDSIAPICKFLTTQLLTAQIAELKAKMSFNA
jgi:hypothetical protein